MCENLKNKELEATRLISEYASNVKYEDIPAQVIEFTKLLILDSVGNSIGGQLLEPGKKINEYYSEMGGRPEATVLSTGEMLPLNNAVYINSYLSNVLDYDDAYKAVGHPGCTIIPPAIAVAEHREKSGKELLTAIITGYETSIRIAQGISPSAERILKVWGTTQHQIFGTVIAASSLLNLDVDQMRNAIGIAGYHAVQPFGNKVGMNPADRPVSWMKNNYGWAAMGGVMAAILTEKGFIGNKAFLDGETGLWIMAASDQCDFELMVSGLGEEYKTMTTEFKPYACCRWAHSAVEAGEILIKNNEIDLRQIQKVDVEAYTMAATYLPEKKPINAFEAQFSLPYLLSITLHGKSPALGLKEEDITSEDILTLSQKVNITVNEELNNLFFTKGQMPSSVKITMKDGTTFEEVIYEPKGSESNPITNDELVTKFFNITIPIVGEEKAKKLYNSIMSMENVTNIKEMIKNIYH
ncbi:MmgE/PrpD family protein [Abyssisolibacter fermentans]|uniref:MmgE/PrpD family protein n=1 Tax=Abyssisolibacter fermentans TaxID=1766203 RepID=UPI00082F903D|nr:MmgE/PrpD family protein [Abyssisolibacter fermentans]